MTHNLEHTAAACLGALVTARPPPPRKQKGQGSHPQLMASRSQAEPDQSHPGVLHLSPESRYLQEVTEGLQSHKTNMEPLLKAEL